MFALRARFLILPTKSFLLAQVRVPFVIKVPGVTDQPNYTHSTPALLDLVDTFPTLSTLAGLPHPVGVDGVDQANVVLQNLHDAKHSALARNASFHQYPACGMSVINMTRSQCNNVPANQFDYMGARGRYHDSNTALASTTNGTPLSFGANIRLLNSNP